jgi:hypothetical protein
MIYEGKWNIRAHALLLAIQPGPQIRRNQIHRVHPDRQIKERIYWQVGKGLPKRIKDTVPRNNYFCFK